MAQGLLSGIRGIGPKKTQLLTQMGLETFAQVLQHFPRDYQDRTKICPIKQLRVGEKACICAVAGTAPIWRRVRPGLDMTRLRVFDESGAMQVVFFNQRYAATQLHAGESYLFYGRVGLEGKQLCMQTPSFEKASEENSRIVPVYMVTPGLTQKDMQHVVAAALETASQTMIDCLPVPVRERQALPELCDCISKIHQPQDMQEVLLARRRLVFEELFLLSCGLARLRERRRQNTKVRFIQNDLQAFWKVLGFTPTQAQMRTIGDLLKDTDSGQPMSRLIQGDVGSGKTAVAQALCALAVQNGYQAAVMAPTEILARQHYETFRQVFDQLGVQTVLLTGSFSEKQKREVKQQIASGDAQIVIGTHAVIQEDVIFHQLGAAVVDEQHRFGVAQRALLSAKGECPHILVMSATPIPRTLALILYGDLDVSVLDELPPGRTPVATYAVGESMRQRVYRFIEKQCAMGGQTYVVCPLVEGGELPLKSAQQHVVALRAAMPLRRIGLLHGRMKPAEKDAVMAQFAAGELDVLVATTVIEVGVNVPNASLMVVEDAERFGLSQLHQLRGRVGRGRRESYCIFFGVDKGENARTRLKLLCRTNDGFVIAKEDLAQRGPGEFFGKRQHGLPSLHYADLAGDMTVLQDAQTEAAELLAKNPELSEYPLLRARIEEMFCGQGDTFN